MKKQNRNSDHSMAHVLYQKLGDQWYAFTEIDGETFMGKVENAEIAAEAQAQAEEFTAAQLNTKTLKAA